MMRHSLLALAWLVSQPLLAADPPAPAITRPQPHLPESSQPELDRHHPHALWPAC